MADRRRHWAGWLLLTLFVVGGLALPGVHRVQHAAMTAEAHAAHHANAATTVAEHDAVGHGAVGHGAVWHEAASVHVHDCDLCATRLNLTALRLPAPPSPLLGDHIFVVPPPTRAPADARAAASIRGPPRAA
jgi:hypothetical protein